MSEAVKLKPEKVAVIAADLYGGCADSRELSEALRNGWAEIILLPIHPKPAMVPVFAKTADGKPMTAEDAKALADHINSLPPANETIFTKLLHACRVAAGKGLRQFAESINVLPSRYAGIESGRVRASDREFHAIYSDLKSMFAAAFAIGLCGDDINRMTPHELRRLIESTAKTLAYRQEQLDNVAAANQCVRASAKQRADAVVSAPAPALPAEEGERYIVEVRGSEFSAAAVRHSNGGSEIATVNGHGYVGSEPCGPIAIAKKLAAYLNQSAPEHARIRELETEVERLKADNERLADRQLPDMWEVYGPKPSEKERIIEAAKRLVIQVQTLSLGEGSELRAEDAEAIIAVREAVKKTERVATPAQPAKPEMGKRYQLAHERGCTCVQTVEQDGMRDVFTTIASFSDGGGHKASESAKSFLQLITSSPAHPAKPEMGKIKLPPTEYFYERAMRESAKIKQAPYPSPHVETGGQPKWEIHQDYSAGPCRVEWNDGSRFGATADQAATAVHWLNRREEVESQLATYKRDAEAWEAVRTECQRMIDAGDSPFRWLTLQKQWFDGLGAAGKKLMEIIDAAQLASQADQKGDG